MAKVDADQNLLFGVLALQMDFISREALIAATSAWVLDKARPLAQILQDQGVLTAARRALLDSLVREHLQIHDDDPARSLASVAALGPLRRELEEITDPDLHASLAGTREDADPLATRATTAGVTGSRFRILRPHARGGLGQVSVALDGELHREVAFKEIRDHHADDPQSRARFVLEAEITGGLEHPGIVPVYGLGTHADGRPYYAMRFIRGDSLREAIDAFHTAHAAPADPGARALAFRKLLGRFVGACNAVAYAHSRGVVHRDLKPENVMLGPFGETLVVDWGLAKATDRAGGSTDSSEGVLRPISASGSAETVAGSTIGTPQYMSPEQASGRLDLVGPASDVYSLGATLYCLLAGLPPFVEPDRVALMRRVQRGDFPPPRRVDRAVPAPLEAICLRAMALKPADRYPSAPALAEEIEHWLADEPVEAHPESPAERLGRWARRHRAWVRAAAAMLVVVTAASMVIANARKREQQALVKAIAQRDRADAMEGSERRRFEALRAEAEALVDAGAAAVLRRDAEAADLRLYGALKTIGAEPRLRALRARAEGLLAVADRQLAEERGRRAARADYEAFVARYDEALYHGTLFTGVDQASSLAKLKAAARGALGVYGVGDEGDAPPKLPAAHLTDPERDRITSRCFVLLVLLSKAEAQGPADPGDTADGRKRRVVRLLDRADGLIPRTAASRAWRAEALAEPTGPGDRPEGGAAGPVAAGADRFLTGLVLYYRNDLARAEADFDAALRADPDHFWAHYFLALCQLKAGRYSEAKAALLACLARKPGFPWLYMLRGYANGELGLVAAAEEDFREALRLAPDHYGIYVNRGAMFVRLRRYPEAAADFARAIALEPKQYQAYANQAEALRRQGRWAEAIEPLDKAIALQPRLASLRRNRALIALGRGDREAARAEYAGAMDLEPPGSPYSRLLAAETHLANGRPAEAIREFDAYEAGGVVDAQFHQGRGLARALTGDYPGAVADYAMSLQLGPNSHVFARRGWAYLVAPERLALRDFDAALEINPGNLDARAGRAYALVRIGKYREAVAEAEAAAGPGLEDWQMAFNVACVFAQAVARAEADEAAPAPDRRALADRYRRRALELVRVALGLVPDAGRRPIVWQTVMAADAALDPIRASPGFARLQAEFGRPASP